MPGLRRQSALQLRGKLRRRRVRAGICPAFECYGSMKLKWRCAMNGRRKRRRAGAPSRVASAASEVRESCAEERTKQDSSDEQKRARWMMASGVGTRRSYVGTRQGSFGGWWLRLKDLQLQ